MILNCQGANHKISYMKNTYKLAGLAILLSATFVCCNDTSTDNEKQVSQDSADKKFNPAGYQKTTDTYDPKPAATDSMYKDKDSIPK